MRQCKPVVLTLISWLVAVAVAYEGPQGRLDRRVAEAQEGQQQEEVAPEQIQDVFFDNTVVVAWNQLAYDIAFAEDQFLTFKGVRAFSMMHIAMHDALNAVIPGYAQYAHFERDFFAHPIAAAAQAAYDVLLSQYPGQQATLDAELADWLSQTPDGPRKARATALGQQASAAIIAMRAGDGWDFQGSYAFRTGIGEYQTTPPWDGFVLQPGFRYATPFGLASQEQFRPPPPPAMDSAEYAAAYTEVKDYGRVDSTVRTPDQTGYAVWWMEFTEGSMNRLARHLVTHRHMHLWHAARLFALLNMSMFDGYVAVWDAKFHYNHWRPYTAIREAGSDGNSATEPDPMWESLRPAPPFPEYASAHSTVCNTSFEIFKRIFGDQIAFTMDTTTAPPDMPTRSFIRFSQASAECADSRVMLGFHFRYATDHGKKLGRRVARYLFMTHLRPTWSQ
jgi:hypothetical protein